MIRRSHPLFACLAFLAGLVLLSSTARAQSAEVYAVDEENGKVLRVDFKTGMTTVINSTKDAASRKGLEGVLVRDDDADGINLVVCDSEGGKVLFYHTMDPGFEEGQVITTMIRRPEGPSAAPNGDLYLVGKKKAGAGPGPQVWKIPRDGSGVGGYGRPVLIDKKVPGDEIEDTRIAPLTAGKLQAGDLLVLSEQPPRVWVYPQAAACPHKGACSACRSLPCPAGTRFKLISENSFPPHGKPNGMAFGPDGTLLVAAEPGRILRFDASGRRLRDFFAGDPLAGELKIATGPQGGKNRAFVTSEDGHSVLRFRVEADGTGSLEDEVMTPDLSEPVGVGVSTAAAAPTLAGANRVVTPTPTHEMKFESVTATGFTNSRVFIFDDPSPNAGARRLSDVPGLLEALGLTMADDRVIPNHIQAFLRNKKGTPTPTFILNVVDTTAGLAKTLQHHVLEQELGFMAGDPLQPSTLHPPTGTDPFDMQPRTFRATTPGDPVVFPDNGKFHDISTGYASNIGRGGGTSLILTARDIRLPRDIAIGKLSAGVALLSSDTPPSAGGLATFVTDPKTLQMLRSLVGGALEDLAGGQTSSALVKIQQFTDTVNNNPQAFDNSTRNVSGELVAGAESTYFMTCGAAPGCNRCLGDCPPTAVDVCSTLNPPDGPAPACSLNSADTASITFVNACSTLTVDVFWVNFSCQEVFYNTLAPNESYTQQTYVTHPWRIREHDTQRLLKEVPAPTIPGSNTVVTVP